MQLCGFRLSHFDPLAEYQTDKQNRRKQTRDAKTNKQTNKKHTQQSLQSRLIEMIQMHCNSFQANWPNVLLGKIRHKWELLAALECPRSPPVEVWTALKKCLYASKSNCFLRKPSIFVKPWPNGLASRCKSPTWVSFGHLLAWSLVKLKFAGKSTQVFHRLATQRKSAQVDRKSTVCVEFTIFATCVNLRADLRICLATLRKSVRKFWFCKLVATCIDLRFRLVRA